MLIEGCGHCDESIKIAAGDLMERHVTKDNVFGMINYCNKHQPHMYSLLKICQSFIKDNFETDDILERGLEDGEDIDKHTVLEILKMKAKKRRVESSFSSFEITVEDLAPHQNFLSGIGLFVGPGVDGYVNISWDSTVQCMGELKNDGKYQVLKYLRFNKALLHPYFDYSPKITISIMGNGEVHQSSKKFTSLLFKEMVDQPDTKELFGVIPEHCFKIVTSQTSN